jgi:hypothetical protein
MEALDFGFWGNAFILLIFLAPILINIIRVVAVFLFIYYLAKKIYPKVSELLGFSASLTGASRFDLYSWFAAVLIITPVICGMVDILARLFFANIPINETVFDLYSPFYRALPFHYYFFISLTIWEYDGNLDRFRFKPLGKVIRRVMVFFAFSLFISFVSFFIQEGDNIVYLWNMKSWGAAIIILYYILEPTLLALLALRFIKNNRRTSL